jgi:hypothetical protein
VHLDLSLASEGVWETSKIIICNHMHFLVDQIVLT